MKITGKFNADVVRITVARNKSHTGKECWVDLQVGADEGTATERFGEAFHALAFGTMQVFEADDEDGDDSFGFLQDSIKPGRRLVCEHHDVVLEWKDTEGAEQTRKVRCQPKVTGIVPIDGKPSVIVTVRLPIETADAKAIVDVSALRAAFDAQQAGLDFAAASGEDLDDDEAEPAAVETDEAVATA